jgi:hypothetical protein
MPPLLKPEQIGICSPADGGDKYLLGVFVYSVTRDSRAQMSGNIRVDASTSARAPLNVEMRVIITPYAGKKSGLADDYKLLERVMQIWHDHSKLAVTTSLQPSHIDAPRLEMLNPDADEISKIWQFQSVPYILSLFYKIAPVAIPSRTQMTSAPVGSADYAGGSGQ